MAGVSGKLMAGSIIAAGVIAGGAIYYLQVYAFYEEPAEVQIELTSVVSGAPEPILAEEVEAIDSGSSPIRFRACFSTPMSQALLTETYATHDAAVPLVAPGWFDCFDAAAIGAALEEEDAIAFMGHENIEYGIDRVVAILPDGRGFAWNQLNICGETVFDGKPAPEGCPPAPERN